MQHFARDHFREPAVHADGRGAVGVGHVHPVGAGLAQQERAVGRVHLDRIAVRQIVHGHAQRAARHADLQEVVGEIRDGQIGRGAEADRAVTCLELHPGVLIGVEPVARRERVVEDRVAPAARRRVAGRLERHSPFAHAQARDAPRRVAAIRRRHGRRRRRLERDQQRKGEHRAVRLP